MRSLLASLEEQENQEGEKWRVGTRTVTVEIPDVDIPELQWPEAALVAHFAFGTPNPIVSEYEPP